MSAPASRTRFVVPVLCVGAIVALVVGVAWRANRTIVPQLEADRDLNARETKVRVDELNALKLGDWDAFDRTAPDRKALADKDAPSRAALIEAEEKWAATTLAFLWFQDSKNRRNLLAGERPARTNWRLVEQQLLALNAIDRTDGRFKRTRQNLLDSAHGEVVEDVAAHHAAKHFHRAHGIARKHAVEWNATATLLGPDEVAKLDALRKKCAALAKPDVPDPDPADEPDVAPPPRPKG